MSLAQLPLLSGRCFRAAMEMAVEMPREDIERDPMILALMLSNTVDTLEGLTAEKADFFLRVLACLIVDWSERLEGSGAEALRILLSAQDAEQLVARVKARRP